MAEGGRRHRGRKAIATLALFASLATLCVPADSWAQTRTISRERRLALAIGNAAYSGSPLQNTEHDARAIGEVLRESDFAVDVVLNTTLREMVGAIDRFVDNVQKGDVALVFYSGHGIQIDGENYLLPIDFNARDEADAKYVSYSASRLHDRITAKGARLTILVLDACRSNPYRSVRTAGAGLAQMSAGYGSFIGFATGPGQTASDNPGGRNGTFTVALLEALRKPGLNLEQVFYEARQATYRASNGRQVPWSNSSVIGEFYFRSGTTASIPAPPSPPVVTRPSPPAVTPSTIATIAELEKNCLAGGIADACNNLGLSYARGAGVTKDQARANSLYERACNGGSVVGCWNLGEVYRSGSLGVPRDSPRALSLYQRACDAGYGRGCERAGFMYSLDMLGQGGKPEAYQWYARACELSDAECWHMGEAHEFGVTVKKDLSLAIGYYRRSCDGHSAVGCRALGQMYEEGRGTGMPVDRAKAIEHYRLGCGYDPTGPSCSDLKRLGVKP